MTKITDRERLLRMTQGESLDDSMRYDVEYSLDIRGNITFWGGMSFYDFEKQWGIDDPKRRVRRRLVPIYEYHRLHPATSRIYQMEEELDETISDERIIEEFNRFRQEHPEDGFGHRLMLITIGLRFSTGQPTDEERELLKLRWKRDDEQEVRDRLLKQERQDIRNLWGIDCPPDINSTEKYNERMMENRGQVSEWFRQEFEKLGGDWEKCWGR